MENICRYSKLYVTKNSAVGIGIFVMSFINYALSFNISKHGPKKYFKYLACSFFLLFFL